MTTDYGTLTDYVTGEPIRPATHDEYIRSITAGPTGAFNLDGRAVFVAGGPEPCLMCYGVREIECGDCDGTGYIDSPTEPCDTCEHTGLIECSECSGASYM